MTRRDWAFTALLTFATMALFLPPALVAAWAAQTGRWWAFIAVAIWAVLGVGVYLLTLAMFQDLAARTSGNRSTTEAHPGVVPALGPNQQTGVGLPEQPTHDPTTCPECMWRD